MSDLTVAVVGATGAVGRVMREILAERSFPVGQLRLMASERSAGTVLSTGFGGIEVEDLATADPSGIDIALFSAGGDRSRQYAPRVRRGRRHRHRQLVGLPDGPRGSPRRGRRQQRGRLQAPGHHRQPQLHDDGADDGGGPAAPGRRPGRHGGDLVSVGVGHRQQRHRRAASSRSIGSAKTPRALIDGGWEEPDHEVFTRPSAGTSCPSPAAWLRAATPTRR